MFLAAVSVAKSQPRPILLLVEDHVDTRQMYAEFLGDLFDVMQAGEGQQALEMMRARRPDVVITDLSLPGIDGFELIKEARKDPALANIPIICLSGYGGHAHDERAREAGCNRIMQKPCMPDALGEAALDLVRTARERSVGS